MVHAPAIMVLIHNFDCWTFSTSSAAVCGIADVSSLAKSWIGYCLIWVSFGSQIRWPSQFGSQFGCPYDKTPYLDACQVLQHLLHAAVNAQNYILDLDQPIWLPKQWLLISSITYTFFTFSIFNINSVMLPYMCCWMTSLLYETDNQPKWICLIIIHWRPLLRNQEKIIVWWCGNVVLLYQSYFGQKTWPHREWITPNLHSTLYCTDINVQ